MMKKKKMLKKKLKKKVKLKPMSTTSLKPVLPLNVEMTVKPLPPSSEMNVLLPSSEPLNLMLKPSKKKLKKPLKKKLMKEEEEDTELINIFYHY